MSCLYDYNIIYDKKYKRITVKLGKDGNLLVTCPKKTKIFSVEQLINNNTKRIDKWFENYKIISSNKQNDSCISIFGEKFVLLACSNRIPKVDFENKNVLFVSEQKEKSLSFVLKQLAENYCFDRINQLAKIYNFSYKSVKITSAKSRWGCCYYNNAICLSKYLAMLPKWVIDYVILHELNHTIYKNHGKQFWQTLKKIYPKADDAKKILKEYSVILSTM